MNENNFSPEFDDEHLDPMIFTTKFFEQFFAAIQEARDDHNTYINKIGEITVDTCFALDCYCWETAVIKENGNCIIVARYKTEEEAKIGHVLWCAICYNQPTKLYSIQMNDYEEL